jgi:hypothetical protein
MAPAGLLLASERLLPSSQGMRLAYEGGRRIVTDGPFVESEELIRPLFDVPDARP